MYVRSPSVLATRVAIVETRKRTCKKNAGEHRVSFSGVINTTEGRK